MTATHTRRDSGGGRTAAARLLAPLLLLAPARATSAQVSGGDTLTAQHAFVLGGVAFHQFEGSSTPAWAAQAGLEWGWPRWGLGARLGALYTDWRRTVVDPVPGCDARCTRATRWFVAGALLEGTLDVRQTRTVRPFLTAGVGAVQSDVKERLSYVCSAISQSCTLVERRALAYTDERASLALTGGAGTEVRAWRINLLAEARVLWRTNAGGAPATMVPVTIGLRL